MIKEFCTENVDVIAKALKQGANRIELCSHLEVGGLTPNEKDIAKATKIAPNKVMVMIRPHANNFNYDSSDLKVMAEQIIMAKQYPIQGFVFGCLTSDKRLDKKAMEYLLPFAGAHDITYHMAFDEMIWEDQKKALKWLNTAGVNRILTHGGPMNQPIDETIRRIIRIADEAREMPIIIMPGGGITFHNLNQITERYNFLEVHGTKIVPM